MRGISRVIMSPTKLKMQHTIRWEAKAGHLPHPYTASRSQCIVGCIFYSVAVGLIITHEIHCMDHIFITFFCVLSFV
jgi:hypothetical protein